MGVNPNMSRLILLFSAFLCVFLCAFGRPALDDAPLFKDEYPKVVRFRGDNSGLDDLAAYEKNCAADLRKMTDEEVFIDPAQYEAIRAYKAAHPDFLFLMHFNGEANQARRNAAVRELYFPGHWLYEAGSKLSEDLSADSETVKVADASPFKIKAYPTRGNRLSGVKETPEFLPHDIVIVPRLKNGRLDWYNAEFVLLKANEGGVLTLARGMYGTSARAFKQGDYIAPLVGALWGGDIQWHYNLSSLCPRDKNGKNASDVFLTQIISMFGEGGKFSHISGVAWDVHYWGCHFAQADVNNDLAADAGIVGGNDTWRDNVIESDKKMRLALGENFIITGDSWSSKMQRGVGLYNGMENEGFCRPNDAFRGFSNPMNMLSYWRDYGVKKNAFSYIVLKFENKAEPDKAESYRYARLALASACALGAGNTRYSLRIKNFSYDMPELFCGAENKSMWLGKPLGAAIFADYSAPDILGGAFKKLTSKTSVIKFSSNAAFVRSQKKGGDIFQEIELPDILNPMGDAVLSFEIKSSKPIEGASAPFPRYLEVSCDSLPKYPDKSRSAQDMYNNLRAYFGDKGYARVSFYFRNLQDSKNKTIKFIIKAEGDGEFEIRNLQLKKCAPLFAREFQNGAVLGNPSFEEKTFDLRKIFPDYKGAYRMIKAAALPNIEPRDKEHYAEELSIVSKMVEGRDGSEIKDPSAVKVGAMDGLFLLKNK